MNKQELYQKVYERLRGLQVEDILDEFFESNVVVPKGENRNKYADAWHAYAEGSTVQGYIPEVGWVDEERDGIEYRIKPSAPVYEWQWSYCISGLKLITNEFMTDEEAGEYETEFVKEEETKRERKQC